MVPFGSAWVSHDGAPARAVSGSWPLIICLRSRTPSSATDTIGVTPRTVRPPNSIEVARNAAPTVKRVAQELGGKSANIILDDADFAEAIGRDAFGMCMNSGQSCNAGTRMLVPKARMAEAAEIAKQSMLAVSVGDPSSDGTTIGPVVCSGWKPILHRPGS